MGTLNDKGNCGWLSASQWDMNAVGDVPVPEVPISQSDLDAAQGFIMWNADSVSYQGKTYSSKTKERYDDYNVLDGDRYWSITKGKAADGSGFVAIPNPSGNPGY